MPCHIDVKLIVNVNIFFMRTLLSSVLLRWGCMQLKPHPKVAPDHPNYDWICKVYWAYKEQVLSPHSVVHAVVEGRRHFSGALLLG